MKLSPIGYDLIKLCEGLRLEPYRDAAGFWTVGYGHKIKNIAAVPERGIDTAVAERLLTHDVSFAEHCVTNLVHVTLTQGQFDALVDFTYNLGPERLAESTLLKLLNADNYEGAADQLKRWVHAAGHELPGLKRRRELEHKLWQTGDTK